MIHKKVIRDKYFYIKVPKDYRHMEIYPTNGYIRSYNKMMLKKEGANFEDYKTSKKGFHEYY